MKAESYESYEVEITRADLVAYVRDHYGLRVPDDAHIAAELVANGRTNIGTVTINWDTKPKHVEVPPRAATP